MGGYRTVDFLTGWRLMLRQLCLSVFSVFTSVSMYY